MRRGRSLAIGTAIVFVISTIFPVVAGLSGDPDSFPRLWGILDVVIAFVLVSLAIVIAGRFDRSVTEEIKQAAYRAYRVLINVILLLLVIFFLAGDRIVWNVFLIGIAWRAWLLFYAFPPWLTALRSNSSADT